MSLVSLTEFLAEERRALLRFENDWRKNHAKDPEKYPLEIDEDAADWWEMIAMFRCCDE